MGTFKRWMVGSPIPSSLAHRERFSRTTGLAVLSSDALSSVAYATEEILRTLLLAGFAALSLSVPIGFAIATLMVLISLAYRQTIHAYPRGGGAYRVARENLGTPAGLTAGAALLTDYVLTVAVSVAAGVAALTSAVPEWQGHRVALSLGIVLLLTIGNLRGVRDSGRFFAVPTYFFLVGMFGLLAHGAWRWMVGAVPAAAAPDPSLTGFAAPLTAFLVLRAFANGCTALTGIEALSDGVPAFRPPEARNATATLLTMAALGVTLFVGVTLLARAFSIVPQADETVLSQLARVVLGDETVWYYAVQGATVLILALAANTAYADFPRLASILARDRFLPRQFMNQGDRLTFSNGIIALSIMAGLLLVAFEGDTHQLIPLYMLGVFLSFTLSQAGMTLRLRGERRFGAMALSAASCTATTAVLVVVTATKFGEGAWITVLLIALVVLVLYVVHRHYAHVAAQLSLDGWRAPRPGSNTVVVPVGGLHRAVLVALGYAQLLGPSVRAVYVGIDQRTTQELREQWANAVPGVPLDVLDSPDRSLLQPLLSYIGQIQAREPFGFVTIVLPEFVPARWWQQLLHNQRALLIKGALLFRRGVVVTNVPFHLDR